MKIKFDFVTNSSSTSYVVIAYDDFTLPNFLESVGIKNKSIFKDIFEDLFYALKEGMTPVRESFITHRWRKAGDSFDDFMKNLYSQETLNKILKAESEGHKVYMGWLDSGAEKESFFCTDAFIIDTDKIFIDGTVDGW